MIIVGVAKWRLSHVSYAVALIVGLLGMVGVSKATFIWQTKPENVVVRDADGELDVANIRGWMSRNTISQHFGIPVERLYTGAGLPAHVSADMMIKEIQNEYDIEFEPDQMRDLVHAWLQKEALSGLPPAPAAPRRADAGAGEGSAAGSPGQDRGRGQTAAGEIRPEGKGGDQGGGRAEDEKKGEPPSVRGNSTINETILKTGIPTDYLLREAGLPDDVPMREPLRDWIHDYDAIPRKLREIVEQYCEDQKR